MKPNENSLQSIRILSVSTSTRGFGFAVLEGPHSLVDWGVKSVEGDKNTQCLQKIEELISHYTPSVIALFDQSGKKPRSAARIQALASEIVALAARCHVEVRLVSDTELQKRFFGLGRGTKYHRARAVAQLFPEELSHRLPPQRRPWTSEDSRMDIFGAVALALCALEGSKEENEKF